MNSQPNIAKVLPPSASDDHLRQLEKLCQRLSVELSELRNELKLERSRDGDENAEAATMARRLYLLHRRRDRIFGEGLFLDPAWDMLLDLFFSEASGRAVTISIACVASCVPQSTALRYIGRLEDKGLLSRKPNPRDGRQSFIVLTDRGRSLMQAFFDPALPA